MNISSAAVRPMIVLLLRLVVLNTPDVTRYRFRSWRKGIVKGGSSTTLEARARGRREDQGACRGCYDGSQPVISEPIDAVNLGD